MIPVQMLKKILMNQQIFSNIMKIFFKIGQNLRLIRLILNNIFLIMTLEVLIQKIIYNKMLIKIILNQKINQINLKIKQ